MKKYLTFIILLLLFVVGCDNPKDVDHDCFLNQSEWIDKIPFTCSEEGIQITICKVCNKELDSRVITKEHEYVEKLLRERTCLIDGQSIFTCIHCGEYYYVNDYAIGHIRSDIEIIKEATDTTLGKKQVKCATCGIIYKEFGYVNNGYHKNGKLSVKGRDLVNQFGEKYQLFGLSTHGIQWFSRYVNFDTICSIQENFGNNIIRFAFYTDEAGYCSGNVSIQKSMLETLHRGIEIATELGLYVIVDWHMVGATNPLDKNPLTYLDEAKEFFSYISEYYKDQDNILYEIMNEPNGKTTWDDCKKYANEVIPCIRKNTDAIILVGNPRWTADLNSVMNSPLVGYENIMYTYHFYAADHRRTTQVENAYDAGFPVFISEFGFMNSDGDGNISTTNGENWKKVLDSRNISYVAWNISNSKGSASIFKHNSVDLVDVSDANLKTWGIYLKNWYRTKSGLNNLE
ncbi:MAG: glycoside hydrolase family 5 protein [Bacilli bacterium]|nr:glycoside hydrolase family 5 protein [Bacilli bacterium]